VKPRELDPQLHGYLLALLESDLARQHRQRAAIHGAGGTVECHDSGIAHREEILDVIRGGFGPYPYVLVVDHDAAEAIRKLVEVAESYDWVRIAKDAVDGRQAWREAITSVASALLKFEIAPSQRSQLCYADFGIGQHCTLPDGHAGDHGQSSSYALDRTEVGHGA
jgi:hypothetical protein